jgi:Skp family chaperone for outer membrane proteins
MPSYNNKNKINMEIRVVDFDKLTKNYANYQDGIIGLSNLRDSFIQKMDPIKEEMESIMKAANSGLILDAKSQQEQGQKFQDLQERAMEIDNEFKVSMRKGQDDLNKKTYDELSSIIEEWSDGKGIDMIMGKMEVVWCAGAVDITESILELLKEKNLFREFKEDEKVEIKEAVLEELK